MNLLQQAINDNKLLLQELSLLLGNIEQHSSELYSQENDLLNNISIGGHVRHILEHYQIFFSALEKDIPIDYDHRERCGECQSSTIKAVGVIGELITQLNEMPAEDHRVVVSIITNPALTDMVSKSSMLREMQFLQSHTVHHLAIIGIVLRNKGIDISAGMTKAPSTRQFEAY